MRYLSLFSSYICRQLESAGIPVVSDWDAFLVRMVDEHLGWILRGTLTRVEKDEWVYDLLVDMLGVFYGSNYVPVSEEELAKVLEERLMKLVKRFSF
jgi:hypothetical protein